MAGKAGQLVRLPDSSSVAIETLYSGSIVTGVQLPGLGLGENDFRGWSSTDISSTTLTTSEVKNFWALTQDTLEFNGGNLIVSEHQKILIKDSSGSYHFIPANTVNLNSDYLVKYTDSGIQEELITSVYSVTDQSVYAINIEEVDVYLMNSYIVHNPPGYEVYSCGGGYIGNFFMFGYDMGPNSANCCTIIAAPGNEEIEGFCIQTCDAIEEAADGIDIAPCDGKGACGVAPSEICGGGDGDLAPGPAGDVGPQGFDGADGSTGSQGTGGAPGPTGGSGAQGKSLAPGPQGSQGAVGLKGNRGDNGDTGPTGSQGAVGAGGSTGAQGAEGDTGPQGSQGAVGPQGSQGAAGNKGVTGSQGAVGVKGNRGDVGDQGPQGAQGAVGAGGSTGAQ